MNAKRPNCARPWRARCYRAKSIEHNADEQTAERAIETQRANNNATNNLPGIVTQWRQNESAPEPGKFVGGYVVRLPAIKNDLHGSFYVCIGI